MEEKKRVNNKLRLMVFKSAFELGSKVDAHLLDMYHLNKDEYTSKSWKNLEKVLQNAQSYLKSGTQEEIDACIKDLQEAKNALVKKQKEDPKPSNDKESQSNKKDTNTGVTSHLKVWTTAMVSSLAGIASILVYKKKHRK